MNVNPNRLEVARFDRIVLVVRGADQLALTYDEASELLYRLADAVGEASPIAQPGMPPHVLVTRDFLSGKERAQGAGAIQRHLRAAGIHEARDTGFVGRLLADSVEQGWLRLTGSGRYALP